MYTPYCKSRQEGNANPLARQQALEEIAQLQEAEAQQTGVHTMRDTECAGSAGLPATGGHSLGQQAPAGPVSDFVSPGALRSEAAFACGAAIAVADYSVSYDLPFDTSAATPSHLRLRRKQGEGVVGGNQEPPTGLGAHLSRVVVGLAVQILVRLGADNVAAHRAPVFLSRSSECGVSHPSNLHRSRSDRRSSGLRGRDLRSHPRQLGRPGQFARCRSQQRPPWLPHGLGVLPPVRDEWL